MFLEGEGVYMDANGEKFTTEEIQEWVDWKRKQKTMKAEKQQDPEISKW